MRTIKSLLLALVSVLAFTGCFSPVFSSIEKEVVLESGEVSGTVNSIIRFSDKDGDWLVVSNGAYVFYKKAGELRTGSESVWTKRDNKLFSSPYYSYDSGKQEGMYIVKTVADQNLLYILACKVRPNYEDNNEPFDYTIYYTDSVKGDSWTELEGSKAVIAGAVSEDVEVPEVKASVFCSNALDAANRTAYLRSYNSSAEKYVYYKLGTTVSEIDASTLIRGDAGKAESDDTLKSVINYNGKDIFFSSLASISGDGCYFFGVGKDLYRMKDGESEAELIYSSDTKLLSLAVTSDYLLMGYGDSTSLLVNDGGIFHISLQRMNGSETFPLNKTDPFVTNADAIMTTSYEVRSLLVEDPSVTEAEGVLFSSIVFKSSGNSVPVSYENKGLWAYYPGRGNWNRE